MRSGPLVQMQPITAAVVHFGLGEHAAVDVARIVWPNGIPQWEFDMASDRLVTAGAKLVDDLFFNAVGDQLVMLRDPWGVPLQLVKRTTPMLA